MKILRRQWLEEMKHWTKKTMVEEDERLNKIKNAKKKKKKKKEEEEEEEEEEEGSMLMMWCKKSFVNFIEKLPI